MSHPSFIYSVLDILTNSGMASGIAFRTLPTILIGNLVRFSKEPPHISVRWFDSGDRNSNPRYPWAICSSITLMPDSTAALAAEPKVSPIR